MAEADPIEGWCLDRESWSFHRQFFERCGRPAEHREYVNILWQIRRGAAEPVCKYYWRVKLHDDRIMVVRGGPIIAKIPNRNARPSFLLREADREDGKVKNRTLANLSKLPIERIRHPACRAARRPARPAR
jgi:hypothetical protein